MHKNAFDVLREHGIADIKIGKDRDIYLTIIRNDKEEEHIVVHGLDVEGCISIVDLDGVDIDIQNEDSVYLVVGEKRSFLCSLFDEAKRIKYEFYSPYHVEAVKFIRWITNWGLQKSLDYARSV